MQTYIKSLEKNDASRLKIKNGKKKIMLFRALFLSAFLLTELSTTDSKHFESLIFQISFTQEKAFY
jgi:hypothetical protein